MGKGNACVSGKAEGLFYVDYDYLLWYTKKGTESDDEPESKLLGEVDYSEIDDWEYDECISQIEQEFFEDMFKEDMKRMFPSFEEVPPRTWVSRYERAVLENGLFYIVFEDNQWSLAVKLLQKEDPYTDLYGLQKKHYERYLDGIAECLFHQFPELGVYGGAWTHGTIKRQDQAA